MFSNYLGNFCAPKQGLSAMKDRPIYAFSSGAHGRDLDRRKSPLPDDIEASGLIKGEQSDSMSFLLRISLGRARRISLRVAYSALISLWGDGANFV